MSVATPGLIRAPGRKVDEVVGRVDCGVAANQILMRGKASAALRLKHVIGEDVLFCQVPVRPDLRRPDVLIDVSPRRASDRNDIEIVHLPVIPVAQPERIAVVRRDRTLEIGRPKAQRTTVMSLTHGRPVGAGEDGEEIVEGAILLNHDDDVLEMLALLRRGRRQEGGSRRAPRCAAASRQSSQNGAGTKEACQRYKPHEPISIAHTLRPYGSGSRGIPSRTSARPSRR